MKNIAAVAFFVAATFFAAGSASAQTHLVKANVPFSFTVGDQTLPSGAYTIGSSATTPTLLTIRNWDKKIAVLSLGDSNDGSRGRDNTMVFHQYGNQYFLREIRSESASMNIYFPTTKAEKRARAEVQEATLTVNDPVLIALN